MLDAREEALDLVWSLGADVCDVVGVMAIGDGGVSDERRAVGLEDFVAQLEIAVEGSDDTAVLVDVHCCPT
jgi:hypothetical protein